MDKIQAAYMRDLIREIFDELDEIKKDEKCEHNFGQSLAYATVLGIVKSYIDEDDWGHFGLDIDIDGKYLMETASKDN